ncbi:helix-turn-helix transcriptional regulator [Iodobacter ciconiae]|uniref:AlpA family phage regulatory protein n=1 Tax=Iodobacter ciconiae TaxID=2496266 RepID=A0A3S8ZPT3_9NEIS|nr:AlpA family phage regulatory protein [Iodobacter ciconiae]AZN35491.1 AlpA family phage regulatory protein [Iodobacter ciconiae]
MSELNSPPNTILRLPDVLARTGLSRSSIYSKMDKHSKYYDPFFPKKIQIGARAIGFIESEINNWIASLVGP